MKKILFVLQAVRSGGSTTSMLNLFEMLKQQGIAVDLFLLQREGIFLDRAEQTANVLPEEKIIASVLCDKHHLKQRGLSAFLVRVLYVLIHKLVGPQKANRMFYSYSAKKLSNQYDTVIAYQESLTTEYVQYIQASSKVAWIHSNYEGFSKGKPDSYWQSLYEKFDEIVCVSKVISEVLMDKLMLQPEHVHVIGNTISAEYIRKCAEEYVQLKEVEYTFVSMGRFVRDKAFERAVSVAEKLKDDGLDYVWYILGHGEEYERIFELIQKRNLGENLILLGNQQNPFPYVRQADCFVMTSRMEAQPMALNEALTLGIPVITTRFHSASEVVLDGVNGFIVDNTKEGILDGILRFISDRDARERITEGAKKFRYNNEKSLGEIMNLMM